MQTLLIDVSEHNGNIDWNQVKGHIDGAILRLGYGMDIASQDDKKWARNVSECERLNIPFGAYLYSYANTSDKARSEAQHALRLLSGHKLSYPVYYDLEERSIEGAAVSNAKIFGDIIEGAGYWCGVYYNPDWNNRVIKNQLSRFTIWGAAYGTNNGQPQSNAKPNFGEDIWQYTSKGSIPGIPGNVDLNQCYRDFPSEINGGGASSGSNPSTPTTPTTPSSTKYKVGDEVTFSTCYKSSTDPISKAISALSMVRNYGKITKIYPGTHNPYLIDNGLCFVNDGDIRGYHSGNTIAVDGKWGSATTTKAQQVFGCDTVDGVMSNQLSCYKNICAGIVGGIQWEDTKRSGSVLVKKMQAWMGKKQDGWIGPNFIKGLQSKMGTTQDGYFSNPSTCIRKFQEWLNNH